MRFNWVFIRGLMSGSAHWSQFLEYFESQFPEDCIHTPDILGNGKNHFMVTPLKVHGNLSGIRNQVFNSEKKIIVGFSLGGMLGLEWAKAHPDEVAGLILINTSVNRSKFYQRYRPKAFLKTILAAFIKDPFQREEKILDLTSTLSRKEKKIVAKEFAEIEKRHPTKAFNFFRQLIFASQVKLEEKLIHFPVLILNSKGDQIVHTSCAGKIAEVLNVPLITHPYAGHDLTLDDPKWVIEQIQTWLKAQEVGEPHLCKKSKSVIVEPRVYEGHPG